MKFLPHPRFAAVCVVATLLSTTPSTVHAVTWDTGAAGTPSSAAGIWDNGTTSNWTTDAGASKTTWNNSNGDTADFTGGTYTVTTANGATLSVGGFTSASGTAATITAGTSSTLTLVGSAPTFSGAGALILGIQVLGSNGLSSSMNALRFTTAAAYTGNTTLTGGQVTLQGSNLLPSSTQLIMSGSATLTVQGNQSVAGLTGASSNIVRNTTATNITLTITGGSNSFAGALSETSTGTLGLTNSGGSLALTGTNSYKGATLVSGGSLSLGSHLVNTSSVTVSGGNLTSSVASVNLGTGSFSLTSGGLSINGASIGTFTLASGQNFTASTGTLNFTLGASNASDQIIGSGSGAFNLSGLTLALNGTTSVAGSYTLFSGFGGTNSISGVTITGLDSGFTGSLGTNGVLTVSAIPEPSTIAALLGVSVLGLAVLRRRKTHA